MDSEEVVRHSRRFIEKLRPISAPDSVLDPSSVEGLHAQVTDFFSTFAGPKSHFTKKAAALAGMDNYRAKQLTALLEAFVDQVETGLLTSISPERKGQLDSISDLMGQAQFLLNERSVHPAAPIVIIGASLEQFLRSWIEAMELSLGARKASLTNYAHVLREAELVDKQDVKDLESWAGLRNHAAHGEWDKVADPSRARIMLESVNLFMRRYQPTLSTNALRAAARG